jgi:hypothetical protein
VLGGVSLAAVDALARARQRPNEIPALWSRIAASGAIAAPLGWLAGRFGAGPRAVGTGAGAVAGLLGVRPEKVVLGPLVGAGVGLALGRLRASTAVVAASGVVAFRLASAAIFRDSQVTLLAERARAEDLPFVVPLESLIR